MELRAVGFDAGEETTGRVWMDDAEIDPKSGNADLRYNGCRLPLNCENAVVLHDLGT